MTEVGQRDILVKIAKLLSRYKIKYLLTGSLAVSFYGFPRATHDIDFVIEISGSGTDKLVQALNNLDKDYLIDKTQFKKAVEKRTQFDVFHSQTGIKIDFWFVKENEFEMSKFRNKRIVVINNKKIPIISPEDLILTKLLWCRDIKSERHMSDCVGIIKVQGDKLNSKYLAEWAEKLNLANLREAYEDYFDTLEFNKTINLPQITLSKHKKLQHKTT